jgi:hypothetical protein
VLFDADAEGMPVGIDMLTLVRRFKKMQENGPACPTFPSPVVGPHLGPDFEEEVRSEQLAS